MESSHSLTYVTLHILCKEVSFGRRPYYIYGTEDGYVFIKDTITRVPYDAMAQFVATLVSRSANGDPEFSSLVARGKELRQLPEDLAIVSLIRYLEMLSQEESGGN